MLINKLNANYPLKERNTMITKLCRKCSKPLVEDDAGDEDNPKPFWYCKHCDV